jgi:hypothetical protein
MTEVLQLNLHRKWFAEIVPRKSASNIGIKSHIGVKGWKDGNTTLSSFAMATLPMRRRCWWSFGVFAGREKDEKRNTPYSLGVSWK